MPGGKPLMQSSRPALSAPAIAALLPDYKATCTRAAQPEQDCLQVARHAAAKRGPNDALTWFAGSQGRAAHVPTSSGIPPGRTKRYCRT